MGPRGLRYMAYAAFGFSVMSLLVKVAGQTLPSSEIVFGRSLVTLILSAIMLRREGRSLWGRHRLLLSLRGLAGFAALLCFFYAITHLPLGDATVIQYLNPVFTALLAALLLGESLRGSVLVGTVGSLAGVALIAQPAFLFGRATRLDPYAVSIGVLGALLSAAAYVLVRRLKGREHYLVIVFYFSLAGTIGALPISVPVWVWPSWTGWGLLIAIGCVTQVAQIYMTRGLHLEEAGRATAIGYLQPVFAFAWGAIFFGEHPGWLGGLGALLILAGTFVIAWTRKAE